MAAARKPHRNRTKQAAPKGRPVPPEREIEALRRELQRVTWERDFLKEAAAFLARTSRSGVR